MKRFQTVKSFLKRPAGANANVRKRPACSDAALSAAGIAKRPAHAMLLTEVQQRIVSEVTEWKNSHEGRMPRQKSDEPTEKKLAKRFSKLPAEIREAHS